MKLEGQRWDSKRCVPWTQPVAPPKLQIPGQTAAPPARVANSPTKRCVRPPDYADPYGYADLNRL
jgi:hypothetical protein